MDGATWLEQRPRKTGLDWANAVLDSGKDAHTPATSTLSCASGIPGLTTEQWASLLTVINNQASSKNFLVRQKVLGFFIQDTPYDQQERYNENFRDRFSIYCQSANDTDVVALDKRYIQLGHNFIVRNVLFILELKYNLFSFGQLLDESDHFNHLVKWFICGTGPYLDDADWSG